MKNYIKLGDYKHEITDKQIEQFKKMLGEDKKKHWVPESGEKIFYVYVDYSVCETICIYTDYQKTLIATGNYYRTESEAQAVADKKLKYDTAVETVKRWIEDELGEQVLDWSAYQQAKYHFNYCPYEDEICIACNSKYKELSPIGHIREYTDCQKLLKALPEEMEIIFK